jgi:hypothetical protein
MTVSELIVRIGADMADLEKLLGECVAKLGELSRPPR